MAPHCNAQCCRSIHYDCAHFFFNDTATTEIYTLCYTTLFRSWMPTLVAVRTNPWLRAYYARLRARGKLPKVALIAALHKLLFAVYSVAKHRRPFVPHLTVQGVEA